VLATSCTCLSILEVRCIPLLRPREPAWRQQHLVKSLVRLRRNAESILECLMPSTVPCGLASRHLLLHPTRLIPLHPARTPERTSVIVVVQTQSFGGRLAVVLTRLRLLDWLRILFRILLRFSKRLQIPIRVPIRLFIILETPARIQQRLPRPIHELKLPIWQRLRPGQHGKRLCAIHPH
jgi:hypothetical protein